MDQFRKHSLVHILSRSGSERTVEDITISGTNSTRETFPLLNLPEETDNDKGPLGLTTLFHPLEPEVTVDIVFIHGLGGGSRKTWSKTPAPSHFWPKSWLPEDPDFQGVRIHSFGYRADWVERQKSILNITDFAQSLLGELKNNPLIRRGSTRLILVGHSMGGCVAKKAYILARQDVSCKDIASRIFSIFFLGTPHRGSDLAGILHKMLTVAWGAKPYVSDLIPNSTTLTEINDAFHHYAADVHLWSFYETMPVKMKVMNKLVVDKFSATLGYSNEEISPMDADHRHVCKFDSPMDPNYRKIRNALCTAVDMAKAQMTPTVPREALAKIEFLLGLADISYEDDLASLQELRHPGSCAWFTQQPHIVAWSHAEAKTPGLLWVAGRPAMGKSVLCSHVIDQFKARNTPCSYFFFKHGRSGRSTLVDCLRGLAYQMAAQDKLILQRLLQAENDNETWDRNDEIAMWRKLFLPIIFKSDTISDHVWVIDGFDECFRFSNWFKLALNLPDGLRVMMTSREIDEVHRGVASLGPRIRMQSISTADTVDDIRAYLTEKLGYLDLGDTEKLCKRILVKSQGSFLWVRLVLQEFETAYTDEDIEGILNDVPNDLHDLYVRMLASIENERRRAKLARPVLSWVALACRPLTIDELRCAIKLDINETPHNMEKAIPAACGQLVFIDQASRVHLIHETVREFLLSEDLQSPLAVKKGDQHGNIASLCCQYLTSEVFNAAQGLKPPRTAKTFVAPDIALVDYASRFFSDHLSRSDSKSHALMEDLVRFLKNSVLHWMEWIACSGELIPIRHTALNLVEYLHPGAKYTSPIDKNMQTIGSWAVDLVRVSARFHSKLLSCPSAIHHLIPPFCPLKSIISKACTTPAQSLDVRGFIHAEWDDCLTCINFREGKPTALAHGESCFAIGLSSGQVSVYDADYIKHISRLQHPERVGFLQFSNSDEYLASAGRKHICIWHPKGEALVWSWPLESPPLAMCFLAEEETLVYIDKKTRLVHGNLLTGEISVISWSANGNTTVPEYPPNRAAMSPELGFLALGYRSRPVHVFDIETLEFLGHCHTGEGNGVDAMAFSSNPDTPVLVVSNTDGSLTVFDAISMELRIQKSNICAHVLSISTNGTCLVTGDTRGFIEVYELSSHDTASLTLVYRIHASNDGIELIASNRDGFRIVSCQGNQACAWEPAILAQKDTDVSSQSDINSQITLPPRRFEVAGDGVYAEITTLACESNGNYIICGNSIGEVTLFATSDGQKLENLYRHSRCTRIIAMALSESRQIIITADDSATILIAKITENSPRWSKAKVLANRRFDTAVFGIVVNPDNDRILLIGKSVDAIWELPSGALIKTATSSHGGFRSAFNHPTNPDRFLTFSASTARIFKWKDFDEITGENGIQLHGPDHSLIPDWLTHELYGSTAGIVQASEAIGRGGIQLYHWRQPSFDSSESPLQAVDFDSLSSRLRKVVAVIGSTLLFLDTDFWVCSLDLTSFHQAPFAKRHFFILSDWLNVDGELLCRFTTKADFIFANKNDIVVVKHGLQFAETITFSPHKGWTVHSGSMHRRTPNSLIASANINPNIARR
ncbi:hypothetical protein F5Y09DRAFT_355828 [Xylaria sp. FL1042]|nr:hypothetical protein F5Y09DRAFT_355828 [Xylaria sp. FL1042]